jgi:hypothetical protein
METQMKSATATQQAWTIDTLIDWRESQGKITPLFSVDERRLARAVAEAYYFWQEQRKLPARAPCDSAAWDAMFMGVYRVQQRRKRRS